MKERLSSDSSNARLQESRQIRTGGLLGSSGKVLQKNNRYSKASNKFNKVQLSPIPETKENNHDESCIQDDIDDECDDGVFSKLGSRYMDIEYNATLEFDKKNKFSQTQHHLPKTSFFEMFMNEEAKNGNGEIVETGIRGRVRNKRGAEPLIYFRKGKPLLSTQSKSHASACRKKVSRAHATRLGQENADTKDEDTVVSQMMEEMGQFGAFTFNISGLNSYQKNYIDDECDLAIMDSVEMNQIDSGRVSLQPRVLTLLDEGFSPLSKPQPEPKLVDSSVIQDDSELSGLELVLPLTIQDKNKKSIEGSVPVLSESNINPIQYTGTITQINRVGFICNVLPLLEAIFDADVEKVREIASKCNTRVNLAGNESIISERDKRGLTPLILATKLSHKDSDSYFKIIAILLESGADPFVKDCEGWTAFEESVNLLSVKIASILFDYISAYKMKKIYDRLNHIGSNMATIPDCFVEIYWEFDSSVIPLVSKFAPSDTLRIWKFGRSIRLDSTLAGYSNLQSKRRDISILGNNKRHFIQPNKREQNPSRTNKQYYSPLEEVDLEEKKAIMYDIFNSLPVQGNFDIKSAKFSPSKGFFGGAVSSKLYNMKCKKFHIDLELEYTLNKKAKGLFGKSKEDYLIPYTSPNPVNIEESHLEQSQREIEFNFNKKTYKISTKETQIKKQQINVHLAKDHPFSLSELIPILKLLATGNDILKRLEEVLDSGIADEIRREGFPVKIQVPMSLSIRANVYFKKFERIESISDSFFDIPDHYSHSSRKESQKILSRAKKRMLLANMIL